MCLRMMKIKCQILDLLSQKRFWIFVTPVCIKTNENQKKHADFAEKLLICLKSDDSIRKTKTRKRKAEKPKN